MLIEQSVINTETMRRCLYLFLLGFTIVLTSCGSMEVITIDYLIPADLSFPPQIRQVGVVNNVNVNAPDNTISLAADTVKLPWELARKVSYHYGDAKVTTESLAEAIAEANYFDEVIISDSVLRADDKIVRETKLSQEEVIQLSEELGVDMIVSLDNIQMKATRVVGISPEIGYIGIVDLKVHPTVTLYIPNRGVPLATITASDSIYWEDIFSTQTRAQTQVISDEKMIQEASAFAGTIPIKYMLPYWQSAERVYFVSNNSLMRDAAVMVKKGSWDEAFKLWQEVHKSKKDKERMQAAFNIALYHEMNDSIDEAVKWATEAFELARSINGFVEPIPDIDLKILAGYGNDKFVLTWQYLKALRARKELQSKLNIQMNRFEDEI